jgi:hypothetical protein
MPFVPFPITWTVNPATGERTFFTSFADYTKSSATLLFQNNCSGPGNCGMHHRIEKDTVGNVMASLDDTLYVTASTDLLDTLPQIVATPTANFAELRNRIPMESFSFFNYLYVYYASSVSATATNTFVATTNFFNLLDQCGVRDIYGLWQYGWNYTNTEVPEITVQPTDVPLIASMLTSLNNLGVRMALGWAITYFSPGSLLAGTLQQHIPLDMNGQPRLQTPHSSSVDWPSLSYPGQQVVINTELAALKNSIPSINSFFFDSDFKQLFKFKINNSPARTGARSMKQMISQARDTLQLARQTVGGPIFNEGYNGGNTGATDNTWQFYGYSDGQEKEYPGQRDCLIIPHFSLFEESQKINNRAPYVTRFHNYTTSGSMPYDLIDWDDYFAQALAFNHQFQPIVPGTDFQLSAGPVVPFNEVFYRVVDTYYRAHELQREFNASPIASISYRDDATGAFLSLEQALAISGFDFQNPRIRLIYENGLTILINFRAQDWSVTTGLPVGVSGSTTLALPRSGWVAWRTGASEFLGYSAKLVGNHVDYVRSANYIYGNGRGIATNFGNGFTTTNLRVERATAPLLVTGSAAAGVVCQ